MSECLSLDLAALASLYAGGSFKPSDLVEEIWRRCEAADPAVWIHRVPLAILCERARELERVGARGLPLFGVPFAIKDNIDLAGAPTTAGCREFSYLPAESAPVVSKLIAAGAIPIGKTNLDQFATGLVGVRSPFGIPRNPFHPDAIPGGSSSGSAVAVATGLASFSLGTDTAGSGRIPASFNNLVGLKPTKGWLSTRGVVPACRSLDCVSVFALSVEDAAEVASLAGGFDPLDPWSRSEPAARTSRSTAQFRFGVPKPEQMEWFGDTHSPALFQDAIRRLESIGGRAVCIDLGPFQETARLLYEGPWVAERWAAFKDFHASHAGAFFPITRTIFEQGASYSAADTFKAFDRLKALQRAIEPVWNEIDVIALPTAPTVYTRDQLEGDPIRLNSRLGHYTNFANLLDLAALAVPAGFRPDGMPFGITLFGQAWSDADLQEVASRFHRSQPCKLGATGHLLVSVPERKRDGGSGSLGTIELAVVGAHLSGQPLNFQLTQLGGVLVRSALTESSYRLYALAGTVPAKPGLIRVAPGEGGAIEIEIWTLPTSAWADFVAAIPSPLGIGSLRLNDGGQVKGFLCESAALPGARDITSYGGWRAYRRSVAQPGK